MYIYIYTYTFVPLIFAVPFAEHSRHFFATHRHRRSCRVVPLRAVQARRQHALHLR